MFTPSRTLSSWLEWNWSPPCKCATLGGKQNVKAAKSELAEDVQTRLRLFTTQAGSAVPSSTTVSGKVDNDLLWWTSRIWFKWGFDRIGWLAQLASNLASKNMIKNNVRMHVLDASKIEWWGKNKPHLDDDLDLTAFSTLMCLHKCCCKCVSC